MSWASCALLSKRRKTTQAMTDKRRTKSSPIQARYNCILVQNPRDSHARLRNLSIFSTPLHLWRRIYPRWRSFHTYKSGVSFSIAECFCIEFTFSSASTNLHWLPVSATQEGYLRRTGEPCRVWEATIRAPADGHVTVGLYNIMLSNDVGDMIPYGVLTDREEPVARVRAFCSRPGFFNGM